MPFWAVSTGNEPMNGIIGPLFVKFMSLGWTGPTQVKYSYYFFKSTDLQFSIQGKWVDENLGPVLKNRFPNMQLLAADDQRYVLPLWIEEVLIELYSTLYV